MNGPSGFWGRFCTRRAGSRQIVDPRKTFDAVADLYDAVRPDYPATLFADLATDAQLQASDRILEIGCGTGLAT